MCKTKSSININGCFSSRITGVKFLKVSDDEAYGENDTLIEMTYRLKDVPDYVGTVEISDVMPFTRDMNSRFVRTLEYLDLMPTVMNNFDPLVLLGYPVEVCVRTEIIEQKLVIKIMDVRSRRDEQGEKNA